MSHQHAASFFILFIIFFVLVLAFFVCVLSQGLTVELRLTLTS